MKTAFASTGRRGLLLALVVSGAAIAAYPLIPHGSSSGSTDPLEHEGKRPEKHYTGVSFAKQTKVVGQASASATATGFDSERVWSGNDDWEPTVALQPNNSSRVYQLTTRYNGTKACSGCPFPVIVIRRSIDGGNTWQA